jgi:hypothetical protein
MFREVRDEPLDAAEYDPVYNDGAVLLPVGADVRKVKPFRHLKVS